MASLTRAGISASRGNFRLTQGTRQEGKQQGGGCMGRRPARKLWVAQRATCAIRNTQPVPLDQVVTRSQFHIRQGATVHRVGGSERPGALVGVFEPAVVVPRVQ